MCKFDCDTPNIVNIWDSKIKQSKGTHQPKLFNLMFIRSRNSDPRKTLFKNNISNEKEKGCWFIVTSLNEEEKPEPKVMWLLWKNQTFIKELWIKNQKFIKETRKEPQKMYILEKHVVLVITMKKNFLQRMLYNNHNDDIWQNVKKIHPKYTGDYKEK